MSITHPEIFADIAKVSRFFRPCAQQSNITLFRYGMSMLNVKMSTYSKLILLFVITVKRVEIMLIWADAFSAM